MIFHQRSLPLTFQLRVSFCARFPSHVFGFCAHLSPFVAWRTSLLGCFCVMKWEYVGIFRRIGRTPFPWIVLRPITLPVANEDFIFGHPLELFISGLNTWVH